MTNASAFAVAVLTLCGCATTLTMGSAPKVVRDFPLPSYQIHEECLALKAGDRVEFIFESTEPVDFNIHYHEGEAVVMPLSREKARDYAGIYAATLAHDYCLMWEAGAAGAMLDYRILFNPRES
jgi:hypothetical protein